MWIIINKDHSMLDSNHIISITGDVDTNKIGFTSDTGIVLSDRVWDIKIAMEDIASNIKSGSSVYDMKDNLYDENLMRHSRLSGRILILSNEDVRRILSDVESNYVFDGHKLCDFAKCFYNSSKGVALRIGDGYVPNKYGRDYDIHKIVDGYAYFTDAEVSFMLCMISEQIDKEMGDKLWKLWAHNGGTFNSCDIKYAYAKVRLAQ